MRVGVGKEVMLGETLTERVLPGQGPVMALISGYDPTLGRLVPETPPGLVCETQYGGVPPEQVPFVYVDSQFREWVIWRDRWRRIQARIIGAVGFTFAGVYRACHLNGTTHRVELPKHGFRENDPVRFADSVGGVTAGTIYYVGSDGGGGIVQPDSFRIKATPSGGTILITDADTTVQGGPTTAAYPGRTVPVIADSPPVRIGRLVVFATDGTDPDVADAKLMCYEPEADSSSKLNVRPFSFKAPTDYDLTAAPTLTPSSHPAEQFFDLVLAGAGFVSKGIAYATTVGPQNDYQAMRFEGGWYSPYFGSYEGVAADQTCFAYDFGAGGKNLADKTYLMMDLALTGTGAITGGLSPLVLSQTGVFINSDQTPYAGGFQIRLHSVQPADPNFDTTGVIRTFALPRVEPNGKVMRLMWHLGTLSSTTIKGLSVRTAPYWNTSQELRWPGAPHLTPTVYSFDFISTWKFKGNVVVPATVWSSSPWVPLLPPDPGVTNDPLSDSGSSAVALEGFPESEIVYDPVHPQVRYAYVFRGRDQLSTRGYRVLISNPSQASSATFSDPWVTCDVGITLPTNGAGSTIMDEYGEYVTHVLLYRQMYQELTDNAGVTAGVWADWDFLGWVAISASPMTYHDSHRLSVVCTMNADPVNTVTSTAHLLNIGDAITFASDVGGVTTSATYYIIATPDANTFQFSSEPEGVAFTITAGGANDWSIAEPETAVAIDDKDIPAVMEVNHDYARSCRYPLLADNRLHGFVLDYDNTSATWQRPVDGEVSNAGDFASFPTTTSGDSATIGIDGQELSTPGVDGATIVGTLLKRRRKVIILNNQFFDLLGDNADQGWDFYQREKRPCVSGRTAVDCESVIISHDGSYFCGISDDAVQAISEGILLPALFDFTKAHHSVWRNQRYLFVGYYDDPERTTPWCLITYDPMRNSWRRHHDAIYQLAGVCVGPISRRVYAIGISPSYPGRVLDLYGGSDFTGRPTHYGVQTRYLPIAAENQERNISYGVIELVTDQSADTVTLRFDVEGRNNSTQTVVLPITSTRTQYGVGDLNLGADGELYGNAVRILYIYNGLHPPEVISLSANVDEGPGG